MRPGKVKLANRAIYTLALLILFGAMIAAGCKLAGIARADPPDLSTESLTWIATGGGQAICQEISQIGMNSNTLIRLFNQVKIARKESDRDTASIVLLSVEYYCPQYWDGMVSIIQSGPAPTTTEVPPLHYAV